MHLVHRALHLKMTLFQHLKNQTSPDQGKKETEKVLFNVYPPFFTTASDRNRLNKLPALFWDAL